MICILITKLYRKNKRILYEGVSGMKLNEQLDMMEAIKYLNEETEEDVEIVDKEEIVYDEEQKFESFDDMMDFLAKDEQEAIDGYDLVLAQIDDEFVKEQLTKIRTEEVAHKEYLEKVKKDRKIEYTEPLEIEDEE